MPNAPYQVSMPSNPRLLRVCNAIIADPSDPRDIDDWAALAAMGRRTFTRSFKQETGMGLAVWRQQRSEEHTSELQSLMRISYAVFSLKKKIKILPYKNHSNI